MSKMKDLAIDVSNCKRPMKQTCLVCAHWAIYDVKTKRIEDSIRASAMSCGHQGLFKLEDYIC